LPNKKSAKKRMRQNKKREARNRAAKSAMKTLIKKSVTLIAEGDVENAVKMVRETQSFIGRLWKRGIVHKNKMRRLQSKLMKKAAAVQKSAA
jgi:small subunit ribosomal protein S20